MWQSISEGVLWEAGISLSCPLQVQLWVLDSKGPPSICAPVGWHSQLQSRSNCGSCFLPYRQCLLRCGRVEPLQRLKANTNGKQPRNVNCFDAWYVLTTTFCGQMLYIHNIRKLLFAVPCALFLSPHGVGSWRAFRVAVFNCGALTSFSFSTNAFCCGSGEGRLGSSSTFYCCEAFHIGCITIIATVCSSFWLTETWIYTCN